MDRLKCDNCRHEFPYWALYNRGRSDAAPGNSKRPTHTPDNPRLCGACLENWWLRGMLTQGEYQSLANDPCTVADIPEPAVVPPGP